MKNTVKEALWFVWIILLPLEGFFLVLWLKFNGLSCLWFPIALIVLWWGITIAVNHFTDKRKKLRQAAYRAQYITQMTLADERFGRIVFDYDSLEKQLTAYPCDLPPFGHHKPYSLTVSLADDIAPAQALAIVKESLHAVYAREGEILAAGCDYVKDTYDDEDLRDQNGNPISAECIREALCIDGFDILINRHCRGTIVEIRGSMDNDCNDHISEHGITIELSQDPDSGEWRPLQMSD